MSTERRNTVRERYGAIARESTSCCGPECRSDEVGSVESTSLGYTEAELARVPEGADLGLGSGNPVAAAALEPGEVVLDLGSGAGIDCFLAAEAVGAEGRVIGVDMTPEMLDRARALQNEVGPSHIEFRLGGIEALPVADETVDVVVSNCVINLSTDRDRVLREAFRVLRPGGRLVVSDMVSDEGAPEALARDAEASCACLPVSRAEYTMGLKSAGFTDISIGSEVEYPGEALSTHAAIRTVVENSPEIEGDVESFVASVRGAIIRARKPT